MPYDRVIYSRHALTRLFERSLRRVDIERVLRNGEVIKRYPDDSPYPSYLMLGRTPDDQPLHVVAADDDASEETHVITTYVPTPEQWTRDFRNRRDRDDE